jgi:hypothetical protein
VHASPLDIFVLVSGSFSILATLPLIYLALRGYRDGRELRVVQREVAALMTEVRELQHEMHHDQRVAASEIVRTKETVERVAEAGAGSRASGSSSRSSRGRARSGRVPNCRV